MTRQAAQKYFNRGRWQSKDGVAWRSWKDNGKWFAEEEQVAPSSNSSSKAPSPEALKAKKMLEEIRLLQNRNERMRSELLRDWTQCMFSSFSGYFGAVAGRIMGLRLDKETARKIDLILKEETAKIQERVSAELEEYENENKVRLR